MLKGDGNALMGDGKAVKALERHIKGNENR